MIRFEPQNILKMLLIFGTSLKCFYKLGSWLVVPFPVQVTCIVLFLKM